MHFGVCRQASTLSGHIEMKKVLFTILGIAAITFVGSLVIPAMFLPNHLIAYQTSLSSGDFDSIQFLIDAGADINRSDERGITPLHIVSQEGHVPVAQLLLSHGANIHARYNALWTPLHLAAQCGHLELVNLLITHGAMVNGPRDDFSPLHFAAQEGHFEIAQLLLSHGANIRAQYHNGWTPLHLAAQEGHPDMVNLLIEQGASLEAQNEQGFTPLHSAVFSGKVDTIQVLLKAGADPMIQDQDGQTPRQLALASQHLIIATLLLNDEQGTQLLLDPEITEDLPVISIPSPSVEEPPNTMPAIDTIPDGDVWDRA